MSPNQKEQEYEDTCMSEDAEQVPEVGNTIRTKKGGIEGKVEGVKDYNTVYFRLADGRLMKTSVENVIVVEKLEDGSMGGINRSAPAVDVSYEKVLDDINEKWDEFNKPVIQKQIAEVKIKETVAITKNIQLPKTYEDRLKYFLNN